ARDVPSTFARRTRPSEVPTRAEFRFRSEVKGRPASSSIESPVHETKTALASRMRPSSSSSTSAQGRSSAAKGRTALSFGWLGRVAAGRYIKNLPHRRTEEPDRSIRYLQPAHRPRKNPSRMRMHRYHYGSHPERSGTGRPAAHP